MANDPGLLGSLASRVESGALANLSLSGKVAATYVGCGCSDGGTPALQNVMEGVMPISTDSDHLAIEALILERCRTLGLTRAELIRRAGFRNEAKGLRRLDELCAGDLEKTASLIQGLPAALELPPEIIDAAVRETERQIERIERRAAVERQTDQRDVDICEGVIEVDEADEYYAAFQHLINNGLVLLLQGFYQDTTIDLACQGHVVLPSTKDFEPYRREVRRRTGTEYPGVTFH